MTTPSIIHLDGGQSIWPNPVRVAELDWILRYGTPEEREEARFVIASVCSAYISLVYPGCMTTKRLLDVRRQIKTGLTKDH